MNSRVCHGHQYIIGIATIFFLLFTGLIGAWYLLWGRLSPASTAAPVLASPPSFGVMEDARLAPIPASAAPEGLFPEIPGVTTKSVPLGFSWASLLARDAYAEDVPVVRPSTHILSEYIFSIVGSGKSSSNITVSQPQAQETDAQESSYPTRAPRIAPNSPQQALKTSATQSKQYYAGYPENWVQGDTIGALDYTLNYKVQIPAEGYYTLSVPYTGCEPAPNGGCVEQSLPQFSILVKAQVQFGGSFASRGEQSAILQHPSVGRLNFDMGRLTKGQNTLQLKFAIPSSMTRDGVTKSFGLQLQPLTLSSSSTLNDAIGIRVLNNNTALPVDLWYADQGIGGQPEAVVEGVDGFPALQDGRTTYVTALNVVDSTGEVYINTYVISYSEGASQETVSIYNQLLRNIRFMTNIANGDEGLKARRDAQRYFDMKRLTRAIEKYKAINGTYPLLEGGTFVKGLAVSTWPSWQQTLGAALGGALPVDPLNKLVGCETFQCSNNQKQQCGKDSDCEEVNSGKANSCQQWGPTTCYDPVLRQFKATAGSYAYAYRAVGNSYEVGVTYEYFDKVAKRYPIVTPPDASKVLDNPGFFSDNRNGNTANTIESVYASQGRCGDGIVQAGEQCEIGQTKTESSILQETTFLCTNECAWSQVPVNQINNRCGDGVLNGIEECDDGNRNGQYGFCNAQCAGVSARCGDGKVNSGYEVCDGPSPDGKVCAPDCQSYIAQCGNGIVESGEKCDSNVEYANPENAPRWNYLDSSTGGLIPSKYGQLRTQKRACKSDCSGFDGFVDVSAGSTTEGARCGDSVADTQKVCHVRLTANGVSTLSATGKTCLSNSDCVRVSTGAGDIVVNGECRPVEQCDDGNTVENDSCTNKCTLPVCGDGIVQGKQCIARSNNRPNGRVCASDKECGSGLFCGIVEECDAGTENGRICNSGYGRECSYCSNSCKIVVQTGKYCGDGNVDVDAGEVCDGAKYLKNSNNPPLGVWPSARADSYFGLLPKAFDLNYRGQANDPATVSVGRYSICAGDCKSACPPAYVTSDILFNPSNPVKSMVLNSWTGGEIKTGSTTIPIPACRWSPVDMKPNTVNNMQLADSSPLKKGFRMSINFDASKIISYSEPKIMFLLDVSGSMRRCPDGTDRCGSGGPGSKLALMKDAALQYIPGLPDKGIPTGAYFMSGSQGATPATALTDSALRGPIENAAVRGPADCAVALGAAESAMSGHGGSKIIVMLSDGYPHLQDGDITAQLNDQNACINKANNLKASGYFIYTIAFTQCKNELDPDHSDHPSKHFPAGQGMGPCALLKNIASGSGDAEKSVFARQNLKGIASLGDVFESITTAVQGMVIEYKNGGTSLGAETLVKPSDNHTLPDFATNLCRGERWDMTIVPKFVPKNPNDLPTITIRDASIDYCPVPQP